MNVHVEDKTVTRYEVWCDDCEFTHETSDRNEAYDLRVQHEMSHREARRL